MTRQGPGKLSLLITLVGLAGIAPLGCASEGDGGDSMGRRRGEAPKQTVSRLGLRAFDSCEALETYIEDGMVEETNLTIDLALRGGLKGDVALAGGREATAVGTGAPPPQTTSAPSAPAGATGSSASSPTAVTRTNTQVEGVDEADFVKNDKTRIFVISGQKLYALQSWPPQDLALKNGVAIEGMPREMFLDEKRNRVVVISEIFTPIAYPSGGGTAPSGGAGAPAPAPDAPTGVAIAPCAELAISGGRGGCGGYGQTSVKLTIFDVSNLASPSIVESYQLPGSYVNSRRVDAAVRVVLTDHFLMPSEVRTYPTSSDPTIYSDKAKLQAAMSQLKVDNERVIRARKLEDWLPKPRYVKQGNTWQLLSYSCNDFLYSEAPTKTGLVTVSTLNLDTPGAAPARTSLVAEPGEVYASRDSLYLASRHWWWWDEVGQIDYTYLHKFDIRNPTRVVHLASGGAEGHIVDQFSMDEHNGVFRVSTTITKRVATQTNICCGVETWNRVTTLGERANALVPLGQSEDLAKGERIMSSRFIGDKGFVVTFRQVDPLFTFDLSDPTKPRKVGELKVPGFSSYIHPLGPNHLLTIGVYTPDPGTGATATRPAFTERRVQLQIFDVTNLADPRQVYLFLVGTAQGQSEALNEHKAFNYFPEKRLLAIPFTDYQSSRTGQAYWDAFVSDVRVYEIGAANNTITERGRLSMKDVYQKVGRTSFPYYYAPYVRRSVMATDGAEDFVYAISDAGVRVANLRALMTPLRTAEFPPQTLQ